MFTAVPSLRMRPSPFFEVTREEGLVSAAIDNRMIMPTSYGDPDAEYWRVINGVSQWDVSVERQVQLKGPDAARLAQILCTRDLSKIQEGQGKYVAICNHRGTIINDPIVLKLADDLFWLSIADSNIWYWADAIANERGLDVEVSEPDVSPMALQGPKAEDVVAAVCGDWVRDIRYFWFRETEINSIPVVVQRSGWSKQGGFEIYLRDGTRARELWNIFREAGQPFGIGPGAPATAERIESGLVSVGADTDDDTNPFEVRLGKYVDLDVPDDVIGIKALRKIAETGSKRHQLGVRLEGDKRDPFSGRREAIMVDGRKVGDLTCCAWSPRMQQNIGFALVARENKAGDTVEVHRASGICRGELVELPFL